MVGAKQGIAKTIGGKIAISTAITLLLILLALGFGYHHATNEPIVQQNQVVEIVKGDSFSAITQKLIAQNIAVNPYWFKVIAYRQGVAHKLKSGEYELTAGLTIPQILTIFAEGRAKKYSITFPEGWSLKDILLAIGQHANITKTLKTGDYKDLIAQLGISDKNPEGWFFPDTYQFEKNATDISILKMAYKKMQSVLAQEWQNKGLNLPYKTPYEALTMASIVEKETGAKHERAKIAGVFVSRLSKGMLLQTDPTVIYGMGDKYKGNIRADDLTVPTPYNTYVIPGLPPTPIAMPGREALHAALHPDKDNSLYFVAKGDGSHQFSATLADHNQAVNTFQRHKK